MIKKILLGLLAILVLIQFIPTEKNDSDERTYAINTKYEVPQHVSSILEVACNDCHTNNTRYPWYANIQPVKWWLNDHVKHGKGNLNFSAFTDKKVAIQNHKFEEVVEMVEEKEMPLDSYTNFGLHEEANLSDEQRQVIIDWAKAQMAKLKAEYPADSLVLKRRKP